MAAIPVIVARRPCGCISMAHAMGPGFNGTGREHQFRHEAARRDCEIKIVPAGQSMKKLDRCDGDCQMPPPIPSRFFD